MRFALVNDERLEAKRGLNGICPRCRQPVIAKCGTQKIPHWAHKSKIDCDSWWETETEWHRSWKSYFPSEWQEVFLLDKETGEKHVADVCTKYGLVIEFQHSSITPEDRISREKFYKNMVWIIDGTRLKNDYERFLKSKNAIRPIKSGFWLCSSPDKYFPKNWVQSSNPVIFDFLGFEETANINDPRLPLYCLFPQKIGNEAMLVVASHENFINATINGKFLDFINAQINTLNQFQQELKKQHVNSNMLDMVKYPRRPRRQFRF